MMSADFEYLSFGAGPGAARKLVVLLHGYGRNAAYMQKMAVELAALVPEAAILCPHAPEMLDAFMDQDETGQFIKIPQELRQGNIVYDRSEMRQWFAIEGSLQDLLPRLERAALLVNRFLDRQRDRFGLADTDVALMGFSQGAGLALYAAMIRAEALAGVVVHSSILLESPDRPWHFKKLPPLLFLYGTNDPEFSAEMYHASFQQLQKHAGPICIEKKIDRLGHFTNAQSRTFCAGFIKDCLT